MTVHCKGVFATFRQALYPVLDADNQSDPRTLKVGGKFRFISIHD